MKNKRNYINPSDRVDTFLSFFSLEADEIRDEIVNLLPAYNILLSLHANSFEEFALIEVAKKQNLDYKNPVFKFSSIKPCCNKCGSDEKVYVTKDKKYTCKKCNSKFTANYNSISSNSNCSSLVWMQVLYCMLEFYSIKRTCEYCGITSTTFYKIRSKIFYAMQLMMDEVKLYWKCQYLRSQKSPKFE